MNVVCCGRDWRLRAGTCFLIGQGSKWLYQTQTQQRFFFSNPLFDSNLTPLDDFFILLLRYSLSFLFPWQQQEKVVQRQN